MNIDDPIVTPDHVVSADASIADLCEDAGGQWVYAILDFTVVWGICKSRDVRPVCPEIPCTVVAIPVA
jgi:hypothetical protein